MTMGEFIAQAVDNELHPKIQITQEDKNMERMRTLAFQVPDSLFQRVKAEKAQPADGGAHGRAAPSAP